VPGFFPPNAQPPKLSAHPAMPTIAHIDWNEITALATCALALGVVVALWGIREARIAAQEDLQATRDAAKATEDATRAQIAASELATRRQIEASYRPLLIEVLRGGPVTPDMEAIPNPAASQRGELQDVVIRLWIGDLDRLIDPREVLVSTIADTETDATNLYVSIPLRNVGNGLAALDPSSVAATGYTGEMIYVDVARPRVPPDETTRVTCVLRLDAEDIRELALVIPYWDLAWGQETEARVALRPVGESWEVTHIEQTVRDPPLGRGALTWRRV
jgi:hypothetical protein